MNYKTVLPFRILSNFKSMDVECKLSPRCSISGRETFSILEKLWFLIMSSSVSLSVSFRGAGFFLLLTWMEETDAPAATASPLFLSFSHSILKTAAYQGRTSSFACKIISHLINYQKALVSTLSTFHFPLVTGIWFSCIVVILAFPKFWSEAGLVDYHPLNDSVKYLVTLSAS